MELRVLSIVGTRPEAIKMAPVLKAMDACGRIVSRLCVTGQHREMLDQVLCLFQLKPAFDLNLMSASQTLNGIVGAAVAGIDRVILEFRPDRVLVQGDTSTALAGALAAFNRGVPVAHVEAGLRTYDLAKPWPEEMNRRAIDIGCDLLLAPTVAAADNLCAERLQGRVVITGNTVIDALMHCAERLVTDTGLRNSVDARLPTLAADRRLVLVTGHRRETLGTGLAGVCRALTLLARRGDVEIVYPVHLNPAVKEPVHAALGGESAIHLIPPQDYLAFVRLMQRADLIITDSGGVQEEAPSLGKPVLVTRTETERPEAIAAGTARLVGVDPSQIVLAAQALLDDPAGSAAHAGVRNPYGDGRAAQRIVAALTGEPVLEFAPEPVAARLATGGW